MLFTYMIWIDIYLSNPDWPKELIRLIGQLLGTFTGNFVSESNGDTAYLIRNKCDENVTVDGKLSRTDAI